MLPYHRHFSSGKKIVINILLSTDIEIAHNKFVYQSIKHLEPFKFYKVEDI